MENALIVRCSQEMEGSCLGDVSSCLEDLWPHSRRPRNRKRRSCSRFLPVPATVTCTSSAIRSAIHLRQRERTRRKLHPPTNYAPCYRRFVSIASSWYSPACMEPTTPVRSTQFAHSA